MSKLKLDLHDIFDKGEKIERALNDVVRSAVEKRYLWLKLFPAKAADN